MSQEWEPTSSKKYYDKQHGDDQSNQSESPTCFFAFTIAKLLVQPVRFCFPLSFHDFQFYLFMDKGIVEHSISRFESCLR